MQQILFNGSHFNYYENYNKIFKYFPTAMMDEPVQERGRPSISKIALIKSFIYRGLNGMSSLSQLHCELIKNLQLAEV
jgi:hypothetical protein